MTAHNPLAGEEVLGARAYRVLFALGSLPLASVAVLYLINHLNAGTVLWDVKDVPGVHELVWIMSFVSFYFLYPSTFNLLEVRHVSLGWHHNGNDRAAMYNGQE